MADKQTQATKRLLKKLSALRKTLPKPERDVLDAIVLNTTAEVIPHAMVQQATSRDARPMAKPSAPEVTPHGMTQKVASGKILLEAKPEVTAHGMAQTAVASKVATSKTMSSKALLQAKPEAPEVVPHSLMQKAVTSKVMSNKALLQAKPEVPEVVPHGMRQKVSRVAATAASATATRQATGVILLENDGTYSIAVR